MKRPLLNTRKQINHRNWRKNNIVPALVIAARKRATRQGIPFTITSKDLKLPSRCPVFGTALSNDYHEDTDNYPSIDRLRPELGYVPGNVAIISRRANRIKSDCSVEELTQIVEYLKERLK